MLPKALAWSSLGLALLFVALALTGVFGWDSLGTNPAARLRMARMLFFYGAVPTIGVSLLFAVVLLFLAAFQSRE
ncbi:MAG: hypothetical protein LW698_05970 [Planctomycetaceae bacterium]|nr:hypothetical protein [Planctomycetaceae bacterium]